jgi:hypothetical protein
MTITERVPHVNSTTTTAVKLAEIRKRALQHGLAIRTGNGGYMIVDRYGAMLAGEGFPLTLGDVEAFLRMWNINKVQQRLGQMAP